MRPVIRAVLLAAAIAVALAGCEYLDSLDDPAAPDPDVPGKASPSLEIPPPY